MTFNEIIVLCDNLTPKICGYNINKNSLIDIDTLKNYKFNKIVNHYDLYNIYKNEMINYIKNNSKYIENQKIKSSFILFGKSFSDEYTFIDLINNLIDEFILENFPFHMSIIEVNSVGTFDLVSNKYFKYYDNLNEDLQNLILSKIRYPISKELDVDIVNFKTFKEDVINTYLKKGFDYDIDGMFYIYYQIENDLIRFFNDDIATMDFITEKNIKKMERILSIKKKLEKKVLKSQSRINKGFENVCGKYSKSGVMGATIACQNAVSACEGNTSGNPMASIIACMNKHPEFSKLNLSLSQDDIIKQMEKNAKKEWFSSKSLKTVKYIKSVK